jgi:hypothetical protein
MSLVTLRARLTVRLVAIGVVLTAASCNRFDRSEVPMVTVGTGLRPEISWSPSPAYTLTVYEGEKDGVPPSNSGVAAAPPLQAGKTYTVVVLRKDEKGSGDGFMNTRRRYVGTRTFAARE